MSKQYVSSVSVEVATAVVTSSGSADADKLVALGNTGKFDSSVLPVATASTLGGIKQGTGISIAEDGTTSVIASAMIPPGAVQYFAMATAPNGWLAANGSAVSRTEYADLFAAIGTSFGSGDGSTTFNLPDLRGEFVRGYDDGRGIDTGRVFGSAQADDFKSHAHYAGTNALGTFGNSGGSGGIGLLYGSPTAPSTLTTTTGGTETRPRNIALLPCIKC